MQKDRLELTDDGFTAIKKLSDGNPGALNVLMTAFDQAVQIDPDCAFGSFGVLIAFDAERVYGSRIWMLFKDVCKQDIVKTMAMLRACQLGILDRQTFNHAIDNYGKGLDVDKTLAAVRERLPNFGATQATTT